MENILLVINIILAAILVVLVLLQKSEGGALGIGVSQDNFMFSRSAGNFMTKATAIVATLFIICSLSLTIISRGEIEPSSEFYDYNAKYIDNKSRLKIPIEIFKNEKMISKIKTLSAIAFKVLNCEGMARIDFLYGSTINKSSKKLSKNQRLEKKKLMNAIKSRVNRGWPTGAVKILQQRDVNILLDQVELDQQKELIAKGYFLANKNELAIKYASEALLNSSMQVPYAAWTAGLASWRLEEYQQAADFFSLFSISLKDDAWHQTSGSFWAARSYAKLSKYDSINFWLQRASQNSNSFYGMLALEILGVEEKIEWKSNKTLNTSNSKLLNLPSGKRLQSLIQVGFNDELEKEIVHINSVLNKEIAAESVNIAQHFNLAYTQLKIVNKLERYGLTMETSLYYPTPVWEPRGGFTINKELIYAFMHQESMFNASAKSNQGAVGLMQVLPSTAKFITSSKDVKRNNSNILKVPEINLEVGQEYIEYLLNLEIVSNNLIYLAAAYNGGPGNLKKWKEETNFLDDPLFFMESIPSRETRWFIEKILTKYWIYQNKNQQDMTSLKMLANGKDPLY